MEGIQAKLTFTRRKTTLYISGGSKSMKVINGRAFPSIFQCRAWGWRDIREKYISPEVLRLQTKKVKSRI